MATGRTNKRYARVYANGYDLSGETRDFGDLEWNADVSTDAALNWEVKGGLPGQSTIVTPPINTFFRFDTTPASSPHDWLNGMNFNLVKVLITSGIRAAPALGDPAWLAVHYQTSYKVSGGDSMMYANVEYGPSFLDGNASPVNLNFDMPWGWLLHPQGAETAASTAIGVDDFGAQTAKGAWMMAQIFSMAGSGTATIKVQDAATNTNPSFADVTGLTTGAVADTAAPTSIVAQTATNATIRRYLRFQVALSGVTSVTFALAVARGR
jgi:hypothetical protein